MKFLIDECLTPELAALAWTRGYGLSSHVVWMKLGGWKDWELKPVILDGDWTFVTRNSADFRGPAASPGLHGQYAGVMIHAGLICLNGPQGMDLDMQLELFDHALIELAADGDLINQVLEITLDENEELHILRYRLPPDDRPSVPMMMGEQQKPWGQLRLLQPRTRTLDGTLHELFTIWYPATPANNVQPVPLAAAARAASRFLLLSLKIVEPYNLIL